MAPDEMMWVVYRPELDKHVETLKGYVIDEDIYPNGGLLITAPLKRRVRRGKGDRPDEWVDLTLEATARYLAQVRSSLTWTAAPVPNADAVPRWSKMTGVSEDVVAPEETEESSMEAYRRLQVETRKIIAAGGPPIALNAPRDKLATYVRENNG